MSFGVGTVSYPFIPQTAPSGQSVDDIIRLKEYERKLEKEQNEMAERKRLELESNDKERRNVIKKYEIMQKIKEEEKRKEKEDSEKSLSGIQKKYQKTLNRANNLINNMMLKLRSLQSDEDFKYSYPDYKLYKNIKNKLDSIQNDIKNIINEYNVDGNKNDIEEIKDLIYELETQIIVMNEILQNKKAQNYNYEIQKKLLQKELELDNYMLKKADPYSRQAIESIKRDIGILERIDTIDQSKQRSLLTPVKRKFGSLFGFGGKIKKSKKRKNKKRKTIKRKK
jgi:membrane-associated HD superfamily phosphohydrolase